MIRHIFTVRTRWGPPAAAGEAVICCATNCPAVRLRSAGRHANRDMLRTGRSPCIARDAARSSRMASSSAPTAAPGSSRSRRWPCIRRRRPGTGGGFLRRCGARGPRRGDLGDAARVGVRDGAGDGASQSRGPCACGPRVRGCPRARARARVSRPEPSALTRPFLFRQRPQPQLPPPHPPPRRAPSTPLLTNTRTRAPEWSAGTPGAAEATSSASPPWSWHSSPSRQSPACCSWGPWPMPRRINAARSPWTPPSR